MRSIRTELSRANWRKSTYSDPGTECLEIADNIPGDLIPVRDSKRPHAPVVVVAVPAWAGFVDAVKAGTLAP